MTLADTGLRYQVLRWTRVVSVTFANQPELSTDGDSWYRTLAGQLVRTLDDGRFQIVASGVRLKRVHADAFSPLSPELSGTPSVDTAM